MKTSTCQYCSLVFNPKPGSFGKFCSLSCSNFFRERANKQKKMDQYNLSPEYCSHCDTPLSFDHKKNKFCSHSCAAKVTNKIDRKRGPTPELKAPFSTIKFIQCNKTGKWFSNRNPDGTHRRVSPYIKSEKEKYYNLCRFRFNIFHFPEEFDISLVESMGWYSCPGSKRKHSAKNTNGISRDHIISVSYGFQNNIDPSIISHPANCRLVPQKENKQKGISCGMTIDELLVKISEWDKKHSEQDRRIELL
jgi:hypothetical protein